MAKRKGVEKASCEKKVKLFAGDGESSSHDFCLVCGVTEKDSNASDVLWHGCDCGAWYHSSCTKFPNKTPPDFSCHRVKASFGSKCTVRRLKDIGKRAEILLPRKNLVSALSTPPPTKSKTNNIRQTIVGANETVSFSPKPKLAGSSMADQLVAKKMSGALSSKSGFRPPNKAGGFNKFEGGSGAMDLNAIPPPKMDLTTPAKVSLPLPPTKPPVIGPPTPPPSCSSSLASLVPPKVGGPPPPTSLGLKESSIGLPSIGRPPSVRHLTLPSPPGPPCKLTTKVLKNSLHVGWSFPMDTGGSEVTCFMVELDRGDGWEIVDHGLKLDFNCENLQPGTEYGVRVAAETAGGTGNYCHPIFITTEPETNWESIDGSQNKIGEKSTPSSPAFSSTENDEFAPPTESDEFATPKKKSQEDTVVEMESPINNGMESPIPGPSNEGIRTNEKRILPSRTLAAVLKNVDRQAYIQYCIEMDPGPPLTTATAYRRRQGVTFPSKEDIENGAKEYDVPDYRSYGRRAPTILNKVKELVIGAGCAEVCLDMIPNFSSKSKMVERVTYISPGYFKMADKVGGQLEDTNPNFSEPVRASSFELPSSILRPKGPIPENDTGALEKPDKEVECDICHREYGSDEDNELADYLLGCFADRLCSTSKMFHLSCYFPQAKIICDFNDPEEAMKFRSLVFCSRKCMLLVKKRDEVDEDGLKLRNGRKKRKVDENEA